MKKKLDLSKLQNAHGVAGDKLFPRLSTQFDTCAWGVNDSGTGRLIQRKPVSGMPRDLEGKRRYLAQLMPRLKEPSLVRALEVMLANDLHVLSYCQPYQAQSSRRTRPGTCQTGADLCTEPTWCGELAALAVGEAMGMAQAVADPLGETGHQSVTRQLIALSTWLWLQEAFGRRFMSSPSAPVAARARQPLDEFDQTDPWEDEHITKVIGEDGEPVRLHPRAQHSAEPVFNPDELNVHLLVMLRDLALHEAFYARVLAQAWDIPLHQIGLESDPENCREERLLLAYVLFLSKTASDSVKARHTRGRRGAHAGRQLS